MKLINEKMKIKNILTKIVQHENIKYYFIICLMGICLSVPLMRGYMIGHDSESHIARVMSTVISLKQHQILPMIASNYVNGLGYSWNMFYPPLTNYLAILLKIFTSTYVQALNLLVGLSIIFSGIFMYHLTEKITKSKKVGLLSAILYITVPYRIADIYVRYALGEIVSFVFIPLVFNGLYSIFEENGKRHFLLTIGAVGLLLTHNITTLLIIFVCAIFIIFHIDQLKDVKKIRTLLFNALWIILIVSCFYGPLLESKNATNYTVFNEFMSENKLGEAQISLWEILIGKLYFSENIAYNHRISVAIGCIITLLTLMTPFVYCKIDKHKRRIYILAVFIGIFCIFASSKYMPWQYMPDIFKFLQFPYRLLIIASFLLSIIAAVNLEKILNGLNYFKISIMAFICLAYVIPLLLSAQIDTQFDENKYYEKEENENPFPGSYSTFCSTYEYLPSKAYNNLKNLFDRTNTPLSLMAEGIVTNVQVDKYNHYTFHVENLGDNILKIEMPLVYYLGYTVTFDGEPLAVEESEIGLVMFTTPNGKSGNVTVMYTGTEVSRKCLIISCISIGLFSIYVIGTEVKIMKAKKEEGD